jgi:hypothetical protein
MMPQQLATTVADGDPVSSRILVVVDESDHAVRALRYVGTLLCDTRDVHVTRFHILKPMPRGILEYGDSKAEACLADNLKKGKRIGLSLKAPLSIRSWYKRWRYSAEQGSFWIG